MAWQSIVNIDNILVNTSPLFAMSLVLSDLDTFTVTNSHFMHGTVRIMPGAFNGASHKVQFEVSLVFIFMIVFLYYIWQTTKKKRTKASNQKNTHTQKIYESLFTNYLSRSAFDLKMEETMNWFPNTSIHECLFSNNVNERDTQPLLLITNLDSVNDSFTVIDIYNITFATDSNFLTINESNTKTPKYQFCVFFLQKK